MFTKFTRRTRLVAVSAMFVAMLTSPMTAAADTTGGGNADLGLDGVTISKTSVASRTGLVTVEGRIECSQDVQAFVWIDVSQVVGRLTTISGGGEAGVECVAAEGSASFSLSFYAWSGKFAGGPARLQGFAEAFICTEEDCLIDFVEIGPTDVRLSR